MELTGFENPSALSRTKGVAFGTRVWRVAFHALPHATRPVINP